MKLSSQIPDRVFLVGPMGVGKTTIGKMLARELNLKFIDSDHEIERRCGAEIAWIFDVEGEQGFRDRESHVIDDLTQMDGILLATGGGAVLREENRQHLKERGVVIHLDTNLELLVRRTAKDKKRPLLQNKNPRAVLEKIKQERDPLYRDVSHVRVYVGDNSSRKAVNQALQQLQDAGYTEAT